MDIGPVPKTKHTVNSAKAALLSVLAAAGIGASTNAINGALSPEYFRVVLGWDFPGIWAASIAQGIMEGGLYGVIFAVVVLLALLVFRRRIGWPVIRLHVLKAMGLVYLAWLVGGGIGLLLACISPDFYRHHFGLLGLKMGPLLRYAWVGGSIRGAIYGGLLSAIITAIGIKNEVVEMTSV
jgi:hypothetical protein